MNKGGGVRILLLFLSVGFGIVCAIGFLPRAGHAAGAYPTKPITVLNSSAAGSPTDVMARQAPSTPGPMICAHS